MKDGVHEESGAEGGHDLAKFNRIAVLRIVHRRKERRREVSLKPILITQLRDLDQDND